MSEFMNIVVTTTVIECTHSQGTQGTHIFSVKRTPGESEIDLERRFSSVQKCMGGNREPRPFTVGLKS